MLFVMVFLACMFCSSAWATEEQTVEVLDKSIDRYLIYGGLMYYDVDGTFSSTKKGRRKVELDMDDLGLDQTEWAYTFGAKINITKRLVLSLDYFGYHQDATRKADFAFNYEDAVIDVGARVDSNLDMDVYVVNLGYALVHTDRVRFGLGFGAHVADLSLKISGKVRVNEEEIELGEGSEQVLAPAPDLYAFGAIALTDRLALRVSGGWMSLSYQDYSGSLLFANALLEYWPFKHVGIGGGYRYLHADIEYETDKKKEEYDVKFPGPLVFLIVGF
jgi:hypothetical protein